MIATDTNLDVLDANEQSVVDANAQSVLDANLNSVSATTFTIVNGPDAIASVMEIDGEVGVTTAARFRGALRYAIVCRPETLTVDMSRISVIDSAGLTVLVAADRRCRDLGIRLLLLAPSAHALRVLEATGLDRVLTVVARPELNDRALVSQPS